MTELWVFAYGSLMWRPDFLYDESCPALLRGAHRALCVRSVVHRGTREKHGLVLGLDLGGECRGVAFRVSPGHEATTRARLRAREQVTFVYRQATRVVWLEDGTDRLVLSLCFLVDRAHPQYAGRIALRNQARRVSTARGRSGTNRQYVLGTVQHMRALGIDDFDLFAVARLLERRTMLKRPRSEAQRHRS